MFPDGVNLMAPREHRAVVRASATAKTSRGTRADERPSAERDGRLLPVVAVAVGGQRGTLYDSFELNAMVARLNRVLNGGEARRPRRAGASWLAAPRVLFRKIKGAFFGARRGGI
ncbi:hypothetical protein QOZ80_3AG0238630 [Eleusine coracana subsp. coracana]|nr:hypothetical protein QOZ80_3AG0238630 [Eleusine coracana subsp. coracana]